MLNIKQKTNIDGQSGLSLIEAMVSLFVFAVGALGVAALQTTALVRTDDTSQRSIAIWKAQELADRMRSTKTITNPDGLIANYITAINNDNSDDGIGVMASSSEFNCPSTAPTQCDDVDGTDVGLCTVAQMVVFDIWSVMCDTNTGLVPDGAAVDGSIGLRNLEVALESDANGIRLYLEWLSRSANNNLDTDGGADTGLQSTSGSARTVVTNLCGVDENIDSRLDAYCLRFQ